MGTEVIGLVNHFSSSLGPTRFKMMTKEKTAKRKLFRMIWGIPVLAILLVAFAEPEYTQEAINTETETFVSSETTTGKIKIRGTVINEDGINMHGTSIIIKGTNIGTVGFTVNEKSEVTNIQILNKNNDVAAKAAISIASNMENWKPGSQRGKAVPVNFAM